MFDEAAKQDFLEYFAASCNVRWAARRAGFSDKTIYKHLMKDERFREGFGRALEQGYIRLQAELLAKAMGTAAIAIDGDRDGPTGEIDVELSLTLLREHARGLAMASGAGRGRRDGRRGWRAMPRCARRWRAGSGVRRESSRPALTRRREGA